MKKLTALLLALILVVSLVGCGAQESTDTDTNSSSQPDVSDTDTNKDAPSGDVEVEVVKCVFDDNELTATDEEYVGSSFPKTDGRVFIDLCLKITNNSNAPFNKDSISGYFMYEDLKYELQFDVENDSLVTFGNQNDAIESKTTGYVHLFGKADEAITKEDIEVNYTINGETYKEKVDKADTREPLEKKTEVKVSDKVTIDDRYEFELIECGVDEYIKAYGCENPDDAKRYEVMGNGKWLYATVKLKNNTQTDLTDIQSYTIVDEIRRGDCKIEIEDNTDLASLIEYPLGAGEEEYIKLYAGIEEDTKSDDLLLRFNLGGNCYYCKPE